MPRPPDPVPAPGTLGRDLPPPPGVTLVEGGADVAVYAGHADGVDVCLFDAGDSDGTTERRVPLVERAHGCVVRLRPGYGVRGSGTPCGWPGRGSPDTGLRHNAAKLLLDPYARAIEGEVTWGAGGLRPRRRRRLAGDGELRSDLDSRGNVPRCVVVDDGVRLGGRRPAEPVPQRDGDLRGARRAT